jgi:hypothetical protein
MGRKSSLPILGKETAIPLLGSTQFKAMP